MDLPQGDVGLWSVSDTDGSACAGSQLNHLVDGQPRRAHFANLMGAALRCYAKNTSALGLPADAATPVTLDATQMTDLGFTDGSNVLTVSAATITKISDSLGNSGYRYETTGKVNDGSKDLNFKSVVQHIYEGGDKFKGTISYYLQDPNTGSNGNCPSASKTHAGYQVYQKVSDSEMAISLDAGTFCGATDPLDTNYKVVPSDAYSMSNTEGWGDNWNYILFRFDPRSGASTYMDGSYEYAWQAGKGDSHTRVFNASLTTTAGVQVGTTYFGYGPPVYSGSTDEENRGKILGMICAWLQGSHTPVDFVQRQIITKTGSGTWTSSAADSKIKYAPTNACQYDAAAIVLTYKTATGTWTNNSDQVAASALADTNNLLSVASGDRDGDGYFKSFSSFPAAPTF